MHKNLILNKIIFVQFSDTKFDPYGRPLVDIFYENIKISTLLIEKGHGVFYDGGKKTLK